MFTLTPNFIQKGMPMSLIKVENLKIGYGSILVVNNVSFEVQEGDYLCVVGENGSGKTTLLKSILGLVQKAEGTVTFADGLCRNNIGYLSQQTNSVGNFPASVKEIVMSGFLNNRRFGFYYSKSEKAQAARVASLVGIDDIYNHSFSRLSGGQQQRVLLARALCATHKLLLLDEPTSALDPIVTAEFYALLRKLNSSGITIIMVSHDVNAAVHNATHILYLNGRENFFGTTHQYVHSEIGSKMLLSACPCDDCRQEVGEACENA